MYSGITQGLFPITALTQDSGMITYTIKLSPALAKELSMGDSVNIDGTCQTVKEIHDVSVTFQAMEHTLSMTTLNELTIDHLVSVERSLKIGDENGGHEVAGHVSGTGTISHIETHKNQLSLTITCPKAWMKYIQPQGFIAIDGSSLTVDQPNPDGFFKVHLTPITLALTHFSNKQVGSKVNIELDHKTCTIVNAVEHYLNLRDISHK